MNLKGRIKANQGPSRGQITGSIVLDLDDGRGAAIEFTLRNPESDDVSIAFRRNGEPFADFKLGMEEGELTAKQIAILQLLPQVLDISEKAMDQNQALREHGRIERFEREGRAQIDVTAHCDLKSELTPNQAELVAPLFV